MLMQHKTLDFGFEIKAINEDGTFTGYGSVFNVQDSYDDIIIPGAFADSLASHNGKGTMPALLWQHRSEEPVGVYTALEEDSIGLKVAGQLALKTTRGAEAYELLKMKAITGLSIGFMTREDAYDKLTGIRTLKKVDLWEVSLVTFPANDAARVSGVKSIEEIMSLREAERRLRDSGFSRTEAVAFLSRVKSLGQSDSEGDELAMIAQALKSRANVFN
jgi:HK97 family phage prohead protease